MGHSGEGGSQGEGQGKKMVHVDGIGRCFFQGMFTPYKNTAPCLAQNVTEKVKIYVYTSRRKNKQTWARTHAHTHIIKCQNKKKKSS